MTQKYSVFVDDNFHAYDEDERYLKGEYDTLEEAIAVAKKMVDDFLVRGYEAGMSADHLLSQYRAYGEDPFVMPGEGGVPFSASEYAEARCKEICGTSEDYRPQENYLKACKFAAEAHNGQLVPGTKLPYLVHLSLVSMEVLAAIQAVDNANLAIQCAWLHDTIEDTDTTYENLKDRFGILIAKGVQVLTKDKSLPKEDQMADSLKRIKNEQKEIWMVKMADRITNLQAPPLDWSNEKSLSTVKRP